MEKKLKQIYDSIVAVDAVGKKYPSIVLSVPDLASAFAALAIKAQSILSTESEQEKNNQGVTTTKSSDKLNMAKMSVAVAEVLQGYAEKNNLPELFKAMSISESSITGSKNAPAISKCMLIYDTASALPPAAILPAGISPAVLQAVQDSINSFSGVQGSTRLVVTNKTRLTENLLQLVKEGNGIMRRQILKYARQFELSQPDFYKELVDAAKVLVTNIHSKIRITAVDENDSPIPGVLVTVSDFDVTGTTDKDGKCTVTRVPEGTRTVTVSKKDYASKIFSDLNFVRGKSISRKALMLPGFDVPAVTEEKVKANA